MGRSKDRAQRFAQTPLEVMESLAWRTLNHSARSTLQVLAVQFAGKHNGIQRLTADVCARFGLNYDQGKRDVAELERRGLALMTCIGGRRPRPPAQYAIGWRQITHRHNELLDRPEPAPNRWAKWTEGDDFTQRSTLNYSAQKSERRFGNSAQKGVLQRFDSAQNAVLLRSGSGGPERVPAPADVTRVASVRQQLDAPAGDPTARRGAKS